jgi:hypothetical protein
VTDQKFLVELKKVYVMGSEMQTQIMRAQKSEKNLIFEINKGSPPNLPVSKPPVMKSKKTNLASASTPETKTPSFKTTKIHNAYLQNSQCQNAQFCCIATK